MLFKNMPYKVASDPIIRKLCCSCGVGGDMIRVSSAYSRSMMNCPVNHVFPAAPWFSMA